MHAERTWAISKSMSSRPHAYDQTTAGALCFERLHALAQRFEAVEPRELQAATCSSRLIAYTTRTRQVVNSVRFDTPWLVLVLEGQKRIDAERTMFARTGQLIVPAVAREFNATNIPDPESGVYRALCIELVPDACVDFRKHHPDLADEWERWIGSDFRALVPDVCTVQALEHVCELMLTPSAHGRVLHHRLEGLLLALLLHDRTRASIAVAAHSKARDDVVLAVRHLIREAPEAASRAGELARKLGLSEATLRRKLAARGQSLRSLILDERMTVARTLLTDGRLSVSEVASRCGYVSPAKFSRQFTRAYGTRPSQLLASARG